MSHLSADPINEKANSWMDEENLRPHREVAHRPRGSRRQMSAQIIRLADRLGVDPDELAARIPEDTIRRTKYPVIEQVDDHGRRSFRHDQQAHEGRRSA